MATTALKLKQASAVLGVTPKDLQNLVQFKILRPSRRDNWFDNRLLLEAKVVLYLKESLSTSTEVLARFTRALSSLKDEEMTKTRYLSFRSRPSNTGKPIEVGIPLSDLAKRLRGDTLRSVPYTGIERRSGHVSFPWEPRQHGNDDDRGIAGTDLHPVQKAWTKFNVPQCGYCQAGQIMRAIALKSNPRRTDQDINEPMSGKFCRCGTYHRIRAAIKAAKTVREVK